MVYDELKECINYSGKIVHFPVNCAISDRNGIIKLNIREHVSQFYLGKIAKWKFYVAKINVKSYTFAEFLSLPKIGKITKESSILC